MRDDDVVRQLRLETRARLSGRGRPWPVPEVPRQRVSVMAARLYVQRHELRAAALATVGAFDVTALASPRERRTSAGQVLACWAILILGSWAALAGVAFAVYFGLSQVWP